MTAIINGVSSNTPTKVGVYAYATATETTTTLADTYYAIAGPFQNTVFEGFSANIDHIVYIHPLTKYVEIIYNGTFESDTDSPVITIAVKQNGAVIPGSEASYKLRLVGYTGSVSATMVIPIAQGDTIQLVVKSDIPGAKIIADTFSASLKLFFQE